MSEPDTPDAPEGSEPAPPQRRPEPNKRKVAITFFLVGVAVFALWVLVMMWIGADWQPAQSR